MTEIQWLVDLMLNYKLPDPVKQKFIARIGEVEAALHKLPPVPVRPLVTAQAPSTQRLLEEMATQTGSAVIETPIAQTHAAAQALEARQQAIKIASSGKPEPGRTSPRKF